MKKKSILLTCIVAIMALVMFVGCDNAPVLPSFVVGGNVTQTGDFLTGQNFDPSKFSVTVTYDNGKIVAADDTVSVMIVGDETVKAGDTAIVDFGIDFKGNHVTKEVAISVYDIQGITVEGPASYVMKNVPTNSELKVTANYLDQGGNEKTMALRSTEFDVSDATYSNSNIGPNASQESVKGYVTVTPLVGQKIENNNVEDAAISTKFEFTATYEPAELPAEIADIVRISFKDSAVLPALKYEEMPVPSFDDFDIVVLYEGSDEEMALEVDPGLEFTYLGMNYEALTSTDFTSTGKNYRAQVTYGDIVKTTTNDPTTSKGGYIAPKTVTLAIAPANSFAKMVEGTTLPELSVKDFIIGANCNNTVLSVDTSKVDLAFSTADHNSAITTPAEGKVPTTGNLYVVAEYLGVENSVNVSSYIVDAPTTEFDGGALTIKTSDTYEVPAAQYYDDINDVISALSADDLDVTLTIDNKEVAINPANLEVYYSTTLPTTVGAVDELENVTLLTDEKYEDDVFGNTALHEVTSPLYIVAEYPVIDEDGNTTIYCTSTTAAPAGHALTAGVPTSMSLDLSYGETVVYGASVKTADIIFRNDDGITSIVPVNADLNVANLRVLVDGKVINAWPAATLEERDVEVLYQTSTGMMTATGIIPDGIDYISAPAADITVGLTAAAQNKTILIGQAYKDIFTVADFVATGKTVSGAEVELDVTAIETGSTLVATDVSYALPVRIAYVDNEGETKSIQKTVTITATEYVVPENGTFTLKYGEGEYKTGDSIAPSASATTANAIFAVSGYDKHLDEDTPDTDLVKIMAVTLQRGSSFDYLNNAYQTIPGDVLTFTIAYVNGTTVDKNDDPSTWPTYTMTLNVVDASTLQ